MIFETHTLEGITKEYIEAIFHFKDFIPEHSIERVVPTGHIFIIFELDGFTRNTFDNLTLKPKNTFTKVWISGAHKNYISISAHQKSEMFVIQFKPFGSFPYFHLPIYELNDKVLPAEDIFGTEILDLREELVSKKTSEEKFKCGEKWLLEKFDSEKTPPPELLGVIEKLEKESVANYGDIVKEYSKTQKYLIEQFKKYVGITPNYFQRILRFNEILQQINQSEKIEWSQVAYQCEYSDQSHFIKEFKHFSGINPQKFLKQGFHKQDPNFFPLDKKG